MVEELNFICEAIERVKTTQERIILLNTIMFGFGIVLITIAVIVGICGLIDLVTKDTTIYIILFAILGFIHIFASFFIGAMQRADLAVLDIAQVEIANRNFLKEVALWDQYISTSAGASSDNKMDIEKAAGKIQEYTKEILEHLQKISEARIIK
jgi:hypothetical protein